MMGKGFCGDCAYFDKGFCYRYPPVNTVTNAVSSYETRNVSFGQPSIQEYHWCGEFKHKKNLIKRMYKKLIK